MTVLGLARAMPDPLTDGLLESIEHSAAELGLTTCRIDRPEDERSVQVLLLVGYPRSYASFLQAPRSARRIAWFGEPLPRPAADAAAGGRRSRRLADAGLRVMKRTLGPMTRRSLPGPLGRLREAAAIAQLRAANLADAIWCSRSVDVVAVTSRDRARVLEQSAIHAAVVPFGFHPAGFGPLVARDTVRRDIPIVVLGAESRVRRLRRGRVLAQLAPALDPAGPPVYLDGVWGADRDAILRRARVMLDIHRVPGNFVGLRFLTAMAAGAVLVTEPIDDPYPFEPGVDHIEAPTEAIAGAVRSVLADEPGRRAIAQAAQMRLRTDLSMRTALARVLAA
jgi:hypothetical protein